MLPARLLPPFHSAQLRFTYRAIIFHEAEDKASPSQAIKRIEVFGHIAPDFSKRGQI
jgi:hypothetical protein